MSILRNASRNSLPVPDSNRRDVGINLDILRAIDILNTLARLSRQECISLSEYSKKSTALGEYLIYDENNGNRIVKSVFLSENGVKMPCYYDDVNFMNYSIYLVDNVFVSVKMCINDLSKKTIFIVHDGHWSFD